MKRKKVVRRTKVPSPVAAAVLIVLAAVAFVSVLFLQTNRPLLTKAEGNCPGKEDVTGACNPACCSVTDSATCPGGEVCSIQNGYCKSGYSCKPKANKVKRTCTQNICAWVSCSPDDASCCDADTDPRCIYCSTNEECVGKGTQSSASSLSSIPNDQRSNTCFNLSLDAEAKKEQNGYTFYPSLKVGSPAGGGDGHIQLFVDGGAKGTNWGWNRGVQNPFVINPDKLGTKHLDSGSVDVNYAVKIDECNERGNYLNITCRYAVAGGKPSVDGPSCSCNGCDAVQPPASSSSAPQASSEPSASRSPSPSSPPSPTPSATPSPSPTPSPTPSPVPTLRSSPVPSAGATVTKQVNVTVSYVAQSGNVSIRVGTACLIKFDNSQICNKLDPSKTEQTTSFTVQLDGSATYLVAAAYLTDTDGYLYQGSTFMNLNTNTDYAIKITIAKPKTNETQL